MRIVILTQYYPPETGAPQNRLSSLARYLGDIEGNEVEILTAMPNYPAMRVHEGYRNRFSHSEKVGGLQVHRSWIFVSRGRGILSRLLNYFSFVLSSLIIGAFRLKQADVLICESPPLFLGLSGWILSRIKGASFVFNISDLWPESAERLGIINNRFLLGAAYKLEAFLYRRSALVSCQTRGIETNINARFSEVKTCWLPNGADLEQFTPPGDGAAWKAKLGIGYDEVVFLYAGIVGHAQGLDVILDAVGLLPESLNVRFVIMGEGPEKERLSRRIEQERISDVIMADGVPKEMMPHVLAAADAAIIPLRKLEIFKGAIPSKIFEAMAMEKPVVLGVEGEAYDLFVRDAGAAIPFIPEDPQSLADAVATIARNKELRDSLGRKGREYTVRYFDRRNISLEFFNKLQALHED